MELFSHTIPCRLYLVKKNWQGGVSVVMNLKISKRQAEEFARIIAPDISEYIQAHQAEFDEYLKNEARKEREKSESAPKTKKQE